MNLLETALFWLAKGYATIPIQYRDKRPFWKFLPKDALGEPTWEVYKTILPTELVVKTWFNCSLRNLALIMGWHGLVVIDFDTMDMYQTWRAAYPQVKTYQVKTSRGMHVYLETEMPAPNVKVKDLYDIKAIGYVLIPPSIHPSGFIYQVFDDAPILRVSSLKEVFPSELLVSPPMDTEYAPVPLTLKEDPWLAADIAYGDTDDLVQKLRDTKPILDYFPQAERKSGDGRWWVACCPFHDDHHPSFWIDTQRRLCGCYSGCTDKPLDVINLFARLHGLSNRDAIFYMMKA